MIALVDYGVGNLFSLRSSFAAISREVTVTDDPRVLRQADAILLPGVGAFRDAVSKLNESGLGEAIKNEAEYGKLLMGICLGMQLLFDRSLEYGEWPGLGLIPGTVRPIADVIDPSLKIPHIGWNGLIPRREHPMLKYTHAGDCVYFVHSYYADTPAEYHLADAEYSSPLTAAVARENVWGCQFHPEKSGAVGLKILRAFCEEADRRKDL